MEQQSISVAKAGQCLILYTSDEWSCDEWSCQDLFK
jgi:hypothetical protein